MKKSKHSIEEVSECQQACQMSDFMNTTLNKARLDSISSSNALAFRSKDQYLTKKSVSQTVKSLLKYEGVRICKLWRQE